ncbi:MAG TPA: hypothetical protein VFF82_08670 [Rhodocyclaceae bacterium]|nr:hypothetical protein [Rhodocyclaceae bacterium]
MRRPLVLPLATAASLFLSLPIRAETVDPIEAASNRIVGNILSEQNLSLIFGLLRQSLTAAAEDKPAPDLPAEISARFETAGKEMQREMGSASVLLLDRIEQDMRESLRDEFVRQWR